MVEDFKRWYDEDPIVQKCLKTLEAIDDSIKRQTAGYLMEQIVTKPPYTEMVPDKIFDLATSEGQKRRWYDYDEAVRIFVELLRHADAQTRREVALKAITFVEDTVGTSKGSIEIKMDEDK